ncbi:hypothetical protein LZ023_23560 [Pseudomonas silvicola]|nr:hypothetical protein LZ023_23560 [Pseudomonas silvicola]
MNWKALEHALFESAKDTLQAVLAEGHGPLHAAVFHASYREEEATLTLPSLALHDRAASDLSFQGDDWNPVDWRWDWDLHDYANAALLALDAPLQAYANQRFSRHWQATEKRFLVTVARAAKRLSAHAHTLPGVAPGFVAFFHDESGDVALARRSLTPAQFETHFPVERALEQQLSELARQPRAQQARFYLSRLGCYDGISTEDAQRWLIAHGDAAWEGLIDTLYAPAHSACAARILGLAGCNRVEVLDALRGQASRAPDEPTRNWCIKALGYLNDEAWLSGQAPEVAAQGLCANFDSFRPRGAHPALLDYAAVERALAARPELETAIEAAFDDCPAWADIGAADVVPAVQGLQSPYPCVRRHAAGFLGNWGEGLDQLALALQALRRATDDADEQVRQRATASVAHLEAFAAKADHLSRS